MRKIIILSVINCISIMATELQPKPQYLDSLEINVIKNIQYISRATDKLIITTNNNAVNIEILNKRIIALKKKFDELENKKVEKSTAVNNIEIHNDLFNVLHAKVVVSKSYLREKPFVDAKVIKVVQRDDIVNIVGKCNKYNWCQTDSGLYIGTYKLKFLD